MYLEHWGLDDFPFENVPNARYFFESDDRQLLSEDLEDAILRRKGAIVLTGNIGCGKSTLIQRTLLNLPEDRFDIALITYASLNPVEMLLEVCNQLDLKVARPDRSSALHAIQEHLIENASNERDTIICIDEAQSIPSLETLEELRMLLNFQLGNRFLLSLIFVGQPEFQEFMAQLPQLQQRIALNLHLGHMSLQETMHYTLHRLRAAGCSRPILTRQALQTVHRHTGGVPRRINHLLDRCLLLGMRQSASLLDNKLVAATMQRYPC